MPFSDSISIGKFVDNKTCLLVRAMVARWQNVTLSKEDEKKNMRNDGSSVMSICSGAHCNHFIRKTTPEPESTHFHKRTSENYRSSSWKMVFHIMIAGVCRHCCWGFSQTHRFAYEFLQYP